MKITPKPVHCHDKFVIDIYYSEGNHYLSCIDIYSKFATLERITTKDLIKNALMIIFNKLGKPRVLRVPDIDSEFTSLALER